MSTDFVPEGLAEGPPSPRPRWIEGPGRSSDFGWVPGATFSLVIPVLLVLAGVVAGTALLGASFPKTSGRNESIALLVGFAMTLGSASLSLARREFAAGRPGRERALLPSGVAFMAGIVALALHAEQVGTGAVSAAAVTLTPGVVPVDTPPPAAREDAVLTGPPAGDAAAGAKTFGVVCSTCHGRDARGVPATGPSLRESTFLAGASDPEVEHLIKVGRPVEDPKNVTKRAMPARGGNPFLTDKDIHDVVAHLRSLGHETAGTSSAGAGAVAGSSPDAVEAHRWIVPPPAEPSTELASAYRLSLRLRGVDPLKSGEIERRATFRTVLHGTASIAHGCLLIGLLVALATWWAAAVLHGSGNALLLSSTTRCWNFGAVAWWVVLVAFLWVG